MFKFGRVWNLEDSILWRCLDSSILIKENGDAWMRDGMDRTEERVIQIRVFLIGGLTVPGWSRLSVVLVLKLTRIRFWVRFAFRQILIKMANETMPFYSNEFIINLLFFGVDYFVDKSRYTVLPLIITVENYKFNHISKTIGWLTL